MLSNATIRHCSRLAGRDCVELPDPATDGPGKFRGMPRGTRPSDGAAHWSADKVYIARVQRNIFFQLLYGVLLWWSTPHIFGRAARRLARQWSP